MLVHNAIDLFIFEDITDPTVYDRIMAASIAIKTKGYDDHYTYGRNPNEPVVIKLLRIYNYEKRWFD